MEALLSVSRRGNEDRGQGEREQRDRRREIAIGAGQVEKVARDIPLCERDEREVERAVEKERGPESGKVEVGSGERGIVMGRGQQMREEAERGWERE